MTGFGSTVATLLAGAAVAVGGVLAGGSGDEPAGGSGGEARGSEGPGARTALVVDASAGRDGRELIDSRLRDADAQVRLPRTPTEAATDIRYFAAQGYRIVVAGPLANGAAEAIGVPAVRANGLSAALAAAAR
jgi:hypothetical protein